MDRFSIYSDEYKVLFKELYKIFRKLPYDFRDDRGIIGCKWSAIFYYIIYLVLKHNIPKEHTLDILREFMKSIFANRAFLHRKYPTLTHLQHTFGYGYLPEKEEYDVITRVSDLDEMITSTREDFPTLLEMGVSEVAQDGTHHISHYFVLSIYRVGEEVSMYIISSWGGEFALIQQYMTPITREQLAELIDDILQQEDFQIDFKQSRISSSLRTHPLLSMPQEVFDEIQRRPMYTFFLKHAYGKRVHVMDKKEFPKSIYKKGRYFSILPEMASLLEYYEYKLPNKPRVTLFKFKHVTSSLDQVFTEFIQSTHPDFAEVIPMEPPRIIPRPVAPRRSIRFTRSNKVRFSTQKSKKESKASAAVSSPARSAK